MAQAPAGAPASPRSCAQDSAPIDLHHLYLEQVACGFTRDLKLYAHQAQDLATHLRGITAIASVLIASGHCDAMEIGPWMQHGLFEAIGALSHNATAKLESINDRAHKEQLQ